jgi:hypothetical protein
MIRLHMPGVEQDLQQIGVASAAATILGWTTPRTIDDARLAAFGGRRWLDVLSVLTSA